MGATAEEVKATIDQGGKVGDWWQRCSPEMREAAALTDIMMIDEEMRTLRAERGEARELHTQAVEALALARAELGRALSESGRLRTELAEETRMRAYYSDSLKLSDRARGATEEDSKKQTERDGVELARLRDVLRTRGDEFTQIALRIDREMAELREARDRLAGNLKRLLTLPARQARGLLDDLRVEAQQPSSRWLTVGRYEEDLAAPAEAPIALAPTPPMSMRDTAAIHIAGHLAAVSIELIERELWY